MQQFPTHVPVLEFSADSDKELLSCLFAERAGRNIRAARISDADACSDESVVRLLLDHDLILIESDVCRKAVVAPAVCLTSVLKESGLQGSRKRLLSWLDDCRKRTPVYGAVLIGGKSRRMGRPKHLIEDEDGRSWLQRLMQRFEPLVAEQVVSGDGDLPASMESYEQVEDLPGMQGPLAGLGALLRRSPYVSWLICACDMPYVTPDAVSWLLEQRVTGAAAVIPENPDTGKMEPLFAWYDYRCGTLVEDLVSAGSRRISDICAHPAVFRPQIPAALAPCWRNINYPGQL